MLNHRTSDPITRDGWTAIETVADTDQAAILNTTRHTVRICASDAEPELDTPAYDSIPARDSARYSGPVTLWAWCGAPDSDPARVGIRTL